MAGTVIPLPFEFRENTLENKYSTVIPPNRMENTQTKYQKCQHNIYIIPHFYIPLST
ncbi:hypothetical protein HMPREF0663_11365 [Hoylesella oralis ATCC 33269]|uniref:Uncharacterized protein n=1 Tax=Hoylesella oralis ATCC 33269 TaxID=873533 RepID=E7RQB4_9BACT|nr:hypothetical protein HMPREF0663_11365 [Hoylesella oralis ATCC 33269]